MLRPADGISKPEFKRAEEKSPTAEPHGARGWRILAVMIKLHAWALCLLAPLCACKSLAPCDSAEAGDALECPVPGEVDRAFDLHVPPSWDGQSPLPLLYAFHGGGGNRAGANSITCPGGDTDDPACLVNKALAAGYAIVLPDGTGTRPLRNVRTWNAGGGVGELQCVSGGACKAGVDDMAYLDKVHDEIEGLLPIDAARVYATGISNGAGITHRYACERPERLAAIVPVSGGNQFAAAGGSCPGGVHVLQVHGTEDPCWSLERSAEACAQDDGKIKIGMAESNEGWRERNGCDTETVRENLPDTVDDGTTSTIDRYQGCDTAVEFLLIEGGGHTWPQGHQYLGEDVVGPLTQDFDLDDILLEFFDAHGK